MSIYFSTKLIRDYGEKHHNSRKWENDVPKNQIIEAWEVSDIEERQEFLKELHKRYSFQRICLSLSFASDCEIRNIGNYNEQNKTDA